MKTLELNDIAIRVADGSGFVFSSPGFAQDDGKSLLVGRVAEEQAKLHPTSTYSKFWQQLSLEPAVNSTVRVRHMGDIAYTHLMHIAQESGLASSDKSNAVSFAIPANFDREQIAILLGICKPCPFDIALLVDLSLAACKSELEGETYKSTKSVVHVDIQQYQTLLSVLKPTETELILETSVQIPGAGMQNFFDSVMHQINELFVQQCRFNPHHNAESEQELYKAIPNWLNEYQSSSTLSLALSAADQNYEIKLPRSALEVHLQSFYEKINQHITPLLGINSGTVLLDSKVANLPGYLQTLNGLSRVTRHKVLQPDVISKACLCLAQLLGDQQGPSTQWLKRVPLLRVDEGNADLQGSDNHKENPTHALFVDRATPVDGLELKNIGGVNEVKESTAYLQEQEVCFHEQDLPVSLGRIELRGDEVYLVSEVQTLRINDTAIDGQQRLFLGDTIAVSASSERIRMIQVR